MLFFTEKQSLRVHFRFIENLEKIVDLIIDYKSYKTRKEILKIQILNSHRRNGKK